MFRFLFGFSFGLSTNTGKFNGKFLALSKTSFQTYTASTTTPTTSPARSPPLAPLSLSHHPSPILLMPILHHTTFPFYALAPLHSHPFIPLPHCYLYHHLPCLYHNDSQKVFTAYRGWKYFLTFIREYFRLQDRIKLSTLERDPIAAALFEGKCRRCSWQFL